MTGMSKDPRKDARRVFRQYGGKVRIQTKQGTEYVFPDDSTMFLHKDENHQKVSEKIAIVRKRFGAIRNTELSGLVKRSGRPTIDFTRLVASGHSKDRLRLMGQQAGVDFPELCATLRTPERVMWSPASSAWVFIGGRLAVAICTISDDRYLIKTVMWSNNDLFDLYPRPLAG